MSPRSRKRPTLRSSSNRIEYKSGEVYEGPTNERGQRHGFGTLRSEADGAFYEGCFVNDMRDGWGKQTRPSDTYVGTWKENKWHGKGTLSWSNGESFQGSFDQGEISGEGRLVMANGDSIEGRFDNQKNPRGWAIKHFASQDHICQAYYADGVRNGYGVYVFEDGSVYRGEWKNGIRHGRGELRNRDGVLTATFINDVAEGLGSFAFFNGDRYDGMFSDHKFHGTGTLTYTDASGRNEYCGEFRNGKRHGYGTLTNAHGDVYEGEFRDNLRGGQGVQTFARHDLTFIGSFRNDKLNGFGQFERMIVDSIDPRIDQRVIMQCNFCCGLRHGWAVEATEGSQRPDWEGSYHRGFPHGLHCDWYTRRGDSILALSENGATTHFEVLTDCILESKTLQWLWKAFLLTNHDDDGPLVESNGIDPLRRRLFSKVMAWRRETLREGDDFVYSATAKEFNARDSDDAYFFTLKGVLAPTT